MGKGSFDVYVLEFDVKIVPFHPFSIQNNQMNELIMIIVIITIFIKEMKK